jgi:hypothetical protein
MIRGITVESPLLFCSNFYPAPDSSMHIDVNKIETTHHVGGIRTGVIDSYGIGSSASGQGCRVAMFDTGAGLRFTVAIDRGGDIVDATYNRYNLTYLSANGYRPVSHAYNRKSEWLVSWPGGLVTSCGPQFAGGHRKEDGIESNTHGQHSNTPAQVDAVVNPDPRRGRLGMKLAMTITESRVSSKTIEVVREISATLGKPEIIIDDVITNLQNTPTPHHWLYHVNFGWPMLDTGARIVMAGRKHSSWGLHEKLEKPLTTATMEKLKVVGVEFPGMGAEVGRGTIIDVKPDAEGNAHTALVNEKIGLGVELEFPLASMSRLANWQAYGGNGSYVMSLEPFSGSLKGKHDDDHAQAGQYLQPGESRRYRLIIRLHEGAAALKNLMTFDEPIAER